MIRAKVSDTRAQQAITLEGRRFSPQEAHEVGLIDDIVKGDTEAVVARAQEVAEGKAAFARSGAYGVIKVCSPDNDRWKCLMHAIRGSCIATCGRQA